MADRTLSDNPQTSGALFALPSGFVIKDRYEIRRILGMGGFAITYQAFDFKLNGPVAVKEYFPQQYAERRMTDFGVTAREGENRRRYRDGLVRFRQEATRTSALQGRHNVVNVIDYAEENETAYMIMELLEGQTLGEYLQTLPGERFADLTDAGQIIAAVAEALSYIHKNKMLHRDVSPDNIFLCADGGVKLIDFGAAREVVENSDLSIVVKSGCTPPEQYRRSGRQGPWTDLYALGATFYRMLTGVYPEPATDRQSTDAAELLPASACNPAVPGYLDRLLSRCLAMDYRLRPAGADEVLTVLRTQKTLTSVEQLSKTRKRLAGTAALMMALCAVMVAVLGVVVYRQNHLLENIALDPCTLYAEVPEHFSTAEGLAEAEALFETMYPMVDVILYVSGEERTESPDIYLARDGTPSAPLTELRERKAGDDLYSDVIAYDLSVLYLNMLKINSRAVDPENGIPDAAIAADSGSFFDEESSFYAWRGGLYDYQTVQSRLPMLYEIYEEPDVPAEEIAFSVSAEADGSVKTAAMRFLLYLSEERTQEILFIHHAGMVPANETVREHYFETVISGPEAEHFRKRIP